MFLLCDICHRGGTSHSYGHIHFNFEYISAASISSGLYTFLAISQIFFYIISSL